MRTINNPTNIENATKPFNTVIVFRNQQLLDLFINNMQGQISDGMWENSKSTEWLFNNVACILGDTTKVVVRFAWTSRRVSYPLTNELWSIIGDRILDENGFNNKKEAFAAWKEIYNAIRNYDIMSEDELEKYCFEVSRRAKKVDEESQEKVQNILCEISKRLESPVKKETVTDRKYIDVQVDEKNVVRIRASVVPDGSGKWWFDILTGKVDSYTFNTAIHFDYCMGDVDRVIEAFNITKEFIEKANRCTSQK